MTPHSIKLPHAYLFLACLAATPALAQASASVTAGNLSGQAHAGPDVAGKPDDRVARGPRTDDTRACDTKSVTVHSANGSSSASVTTSPGGSSSVAASGSPGSRTEYFGCEHNRSTR